MLYQIGSLTVDTRPFNADRVNRTAGADFAKKSVISSLPNREFMGEGDDKLRISGKLLPFKTGGLSALEIAHSFRKNGVRLPVVRGDGKSFGWFVIESIAERHKELMRNGVGFEVGYTISLTKTSPNAGSTSIIGALLSIFEIGG